MQSTATVEACQDNSSANQVLIAGKSPKSLKGKYDRRKNNAKNLAEYRSDLKSGRKVASRKDLAGRRAVTYLREIDSHKSPVQLFIECIEARNYSLAWTIRSDVEARALGKPYVALNPATERHDAADVSRIAVAINNLQIVNNPERPRLTKQGRANQVVTEGEVIPPSDTTSPAQVPLVATNGGECGILPSEPADGIEAAEKAGTLP